MFVMRGSDERSGITTRILRPGTEEPKETDWLTMTPSERMDAVWELTLVCHAWTSGASDEPRLQRSVVRVQRGPR
jgi:hypothetical protein